MLRMLHFIETRVNYLYWEKDAVHKTIDNKINKVLQHMAFPSPGYRFSLAKAVTHNSVGLYDISS